MAYPSVSGRIRIRGKNWYTDTRYGVFFTKLFFKVELLIIIIYSTPFPIIRAHLYIPYISPWAMALELIRHVPIKTWFLDRKISGLLEIQLYIDQTV